MKLIYEDHLYLNGFYQFDREILGLGEIITGGAQLKEAIFKVPGTDLDIITSGEKRFDMSDIVNKEQIQNSSMSQK